MAPRAPSLSDSEVDAVAEQLDRAEDARAAVDVLVHEPVEVADGYRIQAARHRRRGADLVGWKVGCTNAGAQQLLGIDAPLFGRYEPDRLHTSPARLDVESFVGEPRIEVEVGFRLLQDIDRVPRDPLELAEAVEAFAAIEIVDARIVGFPLISAAQLVADNVASGRMIVGPTLDLDADGRRALDSVPVVLSIEAEQVASSTGAEALGHPLRVLQDVALHAGVTGQPLRTGDLVITGTCTGLVAARPGHDHVGRVGGVEVTVRFD